MTNPYPPPCVHSPDGICLCECCQESYDEDPQAYIEFGDHPQGIANWQALQDEMDQARAEEAALPVSVPDPTIPF